MSNTTGNAETTLLTHHRCKALVLVLAGLALLAGCSAPADLERTVGDSSVAFRNVMAEKVGRSDLPTLGDNSTLDDYVRYAALNNPGLEAAYHRWQAAVERIPQVTALPEPFLTYKFYVLAMDMRQSIGIEQMIPGGGKLKLRGDAAFEASQAERQRFDSERVKLINTVKQAYFEYYYLSRATAVTGEDRELVKSLQGVATARYRVGSAQISDVVKGQVELGKIDDQLTSLVALRPASAAKLNAALNRPVTAPLPFPKAIPFEALALSDSDLLATIAKVNPDVLSLDHDIAEQKVMQAAAKAEWSPDYSVGVEYMAPTSTGEDQLALMLGISLPIRTAKYKAMYREAVYRERAAALAKQDRLNALHADAQMALYELRDAERKIALYRDTLLPSARESLKSTETAYAAGKATFLDLLDAERVLLDFMLSQERALANHAQKIAELEMIVGTDLARAAAAAPAPENADTPAPAPEDATPEPPPEGPDNAPPETGGQSAPSPEATPMKTDTNTGTSSAGARASAASSRW